MTTETPRSVATYGQVTGKTISVKVADWIRDMVERYGDEATSAAIVRQMRTGPVAKLLSRVGDQLAAQAAQEQPGSPPVHLDRARLLRIAAGDEPAPRSAYTWTSSDLTVAEYQAICRSRFIGSSLGDAPSTARRREPDPEPVQPMQATLDQAADGAPEMGDEEAAAWLR